MILVLLLIFLFLFTAHIAHLYWLRITGEYIKFFDFNSEYNLPTLFATLNLLFSGYLLFCIYEHKTSDGMKRLWGILAIIFIFLAVDEFAMLHDRLSKPLRTYVSEVDLLHFAWVIPYTILLIAFVLFYLKFFLALPNKYKILFGASGFIFVLGAIGFELLGAPRTKLFGRSDIYYSLFTTIEESLEFLGIILFNFSLMAYFKEEVFLQHPKRPRLSAGVDTK